MSASATPPAPGAESEFKYWAFISYSHRDQAWAEWLHKSIETYRVPRRLADRLAGLVQGAPPGRLFPIFRDRDELGGSFDLDEHLRLALKQSRSLIVICSPASAQSRYVQREIEVFESFGREQAVLCLVVDGEPGASSRPSSPGLECLSPPLRTRSRGGDVVACEPLAADARKNKDGRTNAKLKIIASMLGVAYDELKRREDRRRLQRRIRTTLTIAAATLVLAASYLLALDAGLPGPGGERFQAWLDRQELSVMRPIPDERAIRTKAAELRDTLIARLQQARGDSTAYPANFDRTRPDPWAHNMAIFALLSPPAQLPASFKWATSNQPQPAPDFGRAGSMAIADLWGVMGLARLISKGMEEGEARARLAASEGGIDRFRSSSQPGGWNIFLTEPEFGFPDAYTTTMALMALLETRRAGLPWSGSTVQRDERIRASFAWLVAHFNPRANPPGWHAGTSSMGESADGLTLQVYGRLLDAERELGMTVPDAIAREIPRHLLRVEDRRMDFAIASGEFSTTFDDNGPRERSEAINFLWHPWAVDCAMRWLNRETGGPLPQEQRVAIRRVLGRLVLDLGEEAVAQATRQWTFSASETLYGLSSIPPPGPAAN